MRLAVAGASVALLGRAEAAELPAQPPAAPPVISLGGSDPFARLDGVAQGDLVRTGQVKPVELVDAAIRRIEALNGHINAIVAQRFEQARAEAGRLGPGVGPLRGVPTLVQDIAVAGERLDLGSRLLALVDQRPKATDELEQRLRQAGLVILGRTNMAEAGMASTTESRLWGAVRNPWDTQRTAGGASGGAAAAVAALMVPVAQASDDLGGLRLPAGATGLVGLKPSRGRISVGPNSASWVDIAAARGWLSRSVRDMAALLDVSAGAGATDSFVAPAPMGSYSALLSRSPGRLRIGIMTTVPGQLAPIEPAARIAVEKTAALLQDLGHRVEEAAPLPLSAGEHIDILARYQPLGVARRLAKAERLLGRELTEYDLEPDVYALYRNARQTTVAEFAAVMDQAQDYSRRVLAWWQEGFDLLICPTAGCVAPPLGALTHWEDENIARLHAKWRGFLPMVNLTGQPAISLPLHTSEEGLPLGVQFVANLWGEEKLLQLAAELERLQPWAHRLPPVHA